MLYAILVLVVCTWGGVVGLSGGLVIKPLFFMLDYADYQTIAITSTIIVFFMAMSSFITKRKLKIDFDKKIILFLCLGTFLGSILGRFINDFVYIAVGNEDLMVKIDSILLLVMIFITWISVIKKGNYKTFNIQNSIVILTIGLTLGTISSYLNIGGGPINILFLILFLGLDIKEATIYSIGIIIVSSLTSIIIYILDPGQLVDTYNLTPLLAFIPMAIIGGALGTKIAHNLSEKSISRWLSALLLVMLALNLINLIS